MPAAFWDTYRLGARIPSLDSLISSDAADQVSNLQRALSSVAYIESRDPAVPTPEATADAHFVGRLLLGLLCRGWPSFVSPDVEQALLESIDPAVRLECWEVGQSGQVGWRLGDLDNAPLGTWDDAIRGALLRGDRRLGIDEVTVELLSDSRAEHEFYRDHLASLLGNAIGWLEMQRPLASMVREDEPDRQCYGSQRVDFTLDLPGARGLVRRVIELDGSHHECSLQLEIDRNRDDLQKKHGWQTSRVPVRTLGDGSLNYLPGVLRAIVENNPFPFTHIEDADHALEDLRNREAARLVLTPHAVARVQLALCRALMDGVLDLSVPEWSIAVVEREIPCAEIAIWDWFHALTHLCRLYDIPVRVERVRVILVEEHLTSFPSLPFGSLRHSSIKTRVEPLVGGGTLDRIDLGIDVSIGCHPTRRYPTDPLSQAHLLISRRVALRTAQRQSGYVVDSWPQPRVIANPKAKTCLDSLEYFLRTLFRKEKFREGQMDIIERVLRREDVIGLLPTGAGKSITFQLPALLSPGLSLVIDPLKSLMQDQAENLVQSGVMDSIQINSDTPPRERSKIEWQFSRGEFRLVFISPERLQIRDFRDRLWATAGMRPVAFVVIDEAHCVSEWGHDFRTAYLNLGRIAAEFCGCNGTRPPMIALTGTASESVLRDIQRELDVEADEAIVRPGEFARDELKFMIIPVPKSAKADKLAYLIGTVVPGVLGVEPHDLASGACGGIVFCPHVNGKLGVYKVAVNIRNTLPQFDSDAGNGADPKNLAHQLVAFYSGERPRVLQMSDSAYAGYKADAQRAFKSGRIPLLVATSAFGMGIDKPNIRYTVHYAMAKSVESFAQEAGRAGRDRKDAICAVLFTDRLASREDGGEPPSDCLEPGIAVEEAQERAAAANWDSDDAEMQMYLHTRGYQGVIRESAAVRAFYHHWIESEFPTRDQRSNQLVQVTVSEGMYRETIEDYMQPLVPEDKHKVIVNGADDDKEKMPRPDLQRLIYRLSLLGIIDDYTVSYGFDHVYSLSVRALADDAVRDHLTHYVARYRTAERIREVEEHLDTSPLHDPVCQCIDTLCWFIYEEIEKRRRQGIFNMRHMLRESADGQDFARRLNQTLANTALTRTVFDLLRSDDYRGWALVATEISAAETAEHVYYQCRRALEDAPGHPGLMLLIALALQGSEGERRDEVVANLREGLGHVRQSFARDDQRHVAGWIAAEFARIAPTAAPAILNQVIQMDRDSTFAGAVLRTVAAGKLSADPILMRTSQRCLLHRIDARLNTFING
jgi:ATP-dependent DNA helicase RecQ